MELAEDQAKLMDRDRGKEKDSIRIRLRFGCVMV